MNDNKAELELLKKEKDQRIAEIAHMQKVQREQAEKKLIEERKLREEKDKKVYNR